MYTNILYNRLHPNITNIGSGTPFISAHSVVCNLWPAEILGASNPCLPSSSGHLRRYTPPDISACTSINPLDISYSWRKCETLLKSLIIVNQTNCNTKNIEFKWWFTSRITVRKQTFDDMTLTALGRMGSMLKVLYNYTHQVMQVMSKAGHRVRKTRSPG